MSDRPTETADELRHRAKEGLCRMFSIPEGFSSGLVEQIVDDIVGAAILEVAALQQRAINDRDVPVVEES